MLLVEDLLYWFAQNARDLPWRRTADAYRIWVSEIMLQQTRVAAVIPYYERFLAALPDVSALARADADHLNKLWEGLGYYSRARNMQRAAVAVMERFHGVFPTDYESLLSLPGIGEYTAGAVASLAGNERVPAVDGNVLRVWSRLHNDPSDIALPATKQRVRDAVAAILPTDRPGNMNAALMELGACVCVGNGLPRCGACPVSAHCEAYRAGTQALLPNKSRKRPRRIEEKTVFAIRIDGRYACRRRPDKGLLASLWQLPDVLGTLSEREIAAQLTAWGVRPTGEMLVYARKHVFTHVEWHMQVCLLDAATDRLPDGWRRMDDSLALPTAYRICLPAGECAPQAARSQL